MVAFTSIVATSAALVGLTYAAPSSVPYTGVVHRIFAGSTTANNGLHYEPENVIANIGDLIEFHFLPKNHTIVQSSFDKPCEPLRDASSAVTGKFAGFNFNTTAGESGNVFTFQVENTEPFWYYCAQTVGNHCQAGMSGVINQNFNSDKTLAAYKEKAKTAVTVQASADILASQGGAVTWNTFMG
jgi:plastocyanin